MQTREDSGHDSDDSFPALVTAYTFRLVFAISGCYSDSMNGGCQFLKKDQQKCKHSVANGERFCWQHGTTLQSKVNSLSKNTKVMFCIGIVSLAIGAYGLFQHGNSKNVQVQTSGHHSPVVQDNQGSVTFNDSRSKPTPSNKATKNQKASGASQGNK